jgi:hypothetical protein
MTVMTFIFLSLNSFGGDYSARKAEENYEKMLGERIENRSDIEIDYKPDAFVAYRLRKQDWSYQFSLGVESYQPSKHQSEIDQALYSAGIGNKISIYNLATGLMYNTALFGISAQLFFGKGWTRGDSLGVDRSLSVTLTGAKAGVYFNNLLSEPYVVPYGLVRFSIFGWSEQVDGSEIKTGQAAYNVGSQIGALFQLNWIEPDTSLASQINGMQNTYLDLYLHQNNTSNGADDPDFQSDLSYGLSVMMEF